MPNMNQNNIQPGIAPGVQQNIPQNFMGVPQIPGVIPQNQRMNQQMNANNGMNNTAVRGDRSNYNNREKQQAVPIFQVDFSSKEKMDDFFKERLNKITHRLDPFISSEEKREDLKWSIDKLNDFYERKIASLEEEKKELKKQIWNENPISKSHAVQIFKYTKDLLESTGNFDIDSDPSIQENILNIYNDIVVKNKKYEEEYYNHNNHFRYQDQTMREGFIAPAHHMNQNYMEHPTHPNVHSFMHQHETEFGENPGKLSNNSKTFLWAFIYNWY